MKLGKAWLMDSSSVRLGSREDDIVVLPWPVWGMTHVYRLSDPELPGLSKVKTQFFNRTRGQAVQIGFLTFQRANTHIEYQVDATRGLAAIKVSCDFAGWELAAHSETSTGALIKVGPILTDSWKRGADEAGRRSHAKIWDQPHWLSRLVVDRPRQRRRIRGYHAGSSRCHQSTLWVACVISGRA